ncbi:outer membrane protein assembly factor [Candidatus Photodesmus blepharus]|uniref:Outer membrane protein assembly factor BamA n=2 Tax=Candidatus Photodesmus blepharonis TaxID=1179155 RepID=A0A084CNY2_9GAMM|nr:outer membrane protein assembly factor [Candidatus Photodesmus blepharus]
MKNIVLMVLFATSVLADNAESFVVQDIRIEGLHRVQFDEVISKIPIQIGANINVQDAANIIRSLYALGDFEDIKVLRDNNALIILVKERPTIASISFLGNKVIKEEQLRYSLDTFGVRVGAVLEQATLSNIEKEVEDFYYSVGKYNATVEVVVKPLSYNRSDLTFVFEEGLSAKIQQINFIGNEIFSDKELLSQFKLNSNASWWNFLSDNTYQKRVLVSDIEALKSFYLDRGYLKFQVNSVQVSISPDKKGVYITLWLNEGSPYVVKDVKFQGALLGREEEFQTMVPFEKGEYYNSSLVTRLEEDIKRILGEVGYAYPQVSTVPEFDSQTDEVSLIVSVQTGNRIYVRNIHFIGNHLTKDEVLRREMRQMEGSWLDAKLVDMGKIRLNRLGFFESVNVQIVRVSDSEDQVDLVYSVKEANSGSINLGVGYGTESGLSFQIGLQQNNFLGSGNRVGVNAMINDYQKNITLDYRDPFLNLDGISLGGKIFYNEFEAFEAGIVDYTNESYGANFTWGFPFNELNFFEFGMGYIHSRIGDLPSYFQVEQFLVSQAGHIDSYGSLNINDFDINISWTRNKLNSTYFPTSGNYQRIFYKMTLPGSDIQYFKVQYDIRQYIPLSRGQEFAFLMRGRIGYGNGYGETDGQDNLFPFYENYYAGGFTTLRGFSSNSVGPKAVYRDYSNSNNGFDISTNDSVGGNAIALASLELIVPMPFISTEIRNQVRTSVFIDAASVWDTEFDYRDFGADHGNQYYDYSDPLSYRVSYGASLQWMSPIGPLVFSLAKPIRIYESDDKEFFTFTIGKAF